MCVMHAPRSSHSSLMFSSHFKDCVYTGNILRRVGCRYVNNWLCLTFWVFQKYYLNFPWCNWSWFLPVPSMHDLNNLFSSLLQIHLMYLKFIITSPSQCFLKYILILHTKTYYHFLEVIGIEKIQENFFLNTFLKKLPS